MVGAARFALAAAGAVVDLRHDPAETLGVDGALGKTAERAKALGLEGFTTTLLASREQDGDCVREVGEQVAKRCGVRFFTADLRRLLPDEKRLRGIYKQQYCGCVFSEEERYRDTGKHVYRPGGTRDHEE